VADPVKIDYPHQCLPLAQSGHRVPLNQCPLSGVKRTRCRNTDVDRDSARTTTILLCRRGRGDAQYDACAQAGFALATAVAIILHPAGDRRGPEGRRRPPRYDLYQDTGRGCGLGFSIRVTRPRLAITLKTSGRIRAAASISTSLLAAPSETDRKDESEIGIGNGGRRRR